MNKIKIFLVVGILALVFQAQAQQDVKEKTMFFKGAESVYLDLALGNNISVKGWNKNEVYIKTTVEINGGKLNKALTMSYDKFGDEIKIESDLNHKMLKTGKREDCGDDYNRYNSTMNGTHFYACYKITHEVFMPKNARLRIKAINPKVTLENLNGDLKINTVNGSITMAAKKIQASQNLELKTVNGKIDFTVPANASTRVRMSTVNGGIYSHFEVPRETKDGMRSIGGGRFNKKIKFTLGSGSAYTNLSTVNGKIYLRKAK